MKKIMLGTLIIAGALALGGCADPTGNGDNKTVVRVNFGDASWATGTVTSTTNPQMRVTIKPDELVINCPIGYIPAPNFTGTVNVLTSSAYTLINESGEIRNGIVLVITNENVIEQEFLHNYDPLVTYPNLFNDELIDIACLEGTPEDWDITKPL